MLLFNSQFKTKPEFTQEEFLSLIQKWLKTTLQSPKNTYHFSKESLAEIEDLKKKKTGDVLLVSEDNVKTIHLIRTESAIGASVTSDYKSDVHTSSYVLRDQVMTIQLSLNQRTITSFNHYPEVHIPNLMKRIFWEEFVDTDEIIPTNDKALYINKSDVNTFVRPVLLEHKVKPIMPIVYISSFASGRYALNTDVLASDLIGIAHVVVEASPAVSEKIAEITAPYFEKSEFFDFAEDGSVAIYMPGGYMERLSVSKSLAYDLKTRLYRATTLMPIESKYLFNNLSQAKILDKYKDDEELTELFDSIVKDKDNETKVLNDKIAELEEELKNIKTENMNLKAAKDSMSKKFLITDGEGSTECCKLVCGEKEIYDGEINDVVLKALTSMADSMSSDPNMKESRKYHILTNLLSLNMTTGQDDVISKAIKEALKDGTVSSDSVRQLSLYGFKVIHEKKHDRLQFGDDNRYSVIVARTPSDGREGKNCASIFTNTLFGF